MPDIETAIEMGATICVISMAYESVRMEYPEARLLSIQWYPTGSAYLLYNMTCDAMLMAQTDIDNMYAGYHQEGDCQRVASGDLPEQDGHCAKGFGEEPRNDC